MNSLVRIHKGKQPISKHYLKEWLDERDMGAMDLLDEINKALPDPIDKSQVYRWLKGQMPHDDMLVRIAGVLSIVDAETGAPDPRGVLRDPNVDWIAQKLRGRSEDEVERVKQILDAAFPPKKRA